MKTYSLNNMNNLSANLQQNHKVCFINSNSNIYQYDDIYSEITGAS